MPCCGRCPVLVVGACAAIGLLLPCAIVYVGGVRVLTDGLVFLAFPKAASMFDELELDTKDMLVAAGVVLVMNGRECAGFGVPNDTDVLDGLCWLASYRIEIEEDVRSAGGLCDRGGMAAWRRLRSRLAEMGAVDRIDMVALAAKSEGGEV